MKRKHCTINQNAVWEKKFILKAAKSAYFTPEQILGCQTMDDLHQLQILARQMIEVKDFAQALRDQERSR